MTRFFSAGIFFIFLFLAGMSGLLHVKQLLKNTGMPDFVDIAQGKWAPQFEKALGAYIDTSSKNFWGNLEYAIFHQGRKGVIIGNNNWLFTDEEFSCPQNAAENMAGNFSFIKESQKILAQKNVKTVVVLVPTKSRVYPQYLGGNKIPPCREKVYADALAFLKTQQIPSTNLLSVMHDDNLYLRTDTHWTPAGAKMAAEEMRKLVHMALPGAHFETVAGAEKIHEGDLMRYTPGVPIPPDRFIPATTEAQGGGLLDDVAVPQTVLVGTSYSANPNWNFAGFLKEALQTDILNMADEGQGPMTVMDHYLGSDAFKNTPPRLLIWEIPERYLLMPHGVSGK